MVYPTLRDRRRIRRRATSADVSIFYWLWPVNWFTPYPMMDVWDEIPVSEQSQELDPSLAPEEPLILDEPVDEIVPEEVDDVLETPEGAPDPVVVEEPAYEPPAYEPPAYDPPAYETPKYDTPSYGGDVGGGSSDSGGGDSFSSD